MSALFPGSSEPLHFSVLAFTSPSKSYVTADPGYEAGMHAAKISGARVVKTPLTASYGHDVKAMITAASDAGLFYVCTPNNPTGTLTPQVEIEYLVEHKPKGSIVLVDEAYIHFSDATTALDLVKADKDVVVLRTFSKIYGMAGLRCGLAIGRPDLIEKVSSFSGWNSLPVTAVAAALRTRPAGRESSPVRCICLRPPARNRRLNLERSRRLSRYRRRHGVPAEKGKPVEVAVTFICELTFTGYRAKLVNEVTLPFVICSGLT